MPSYIITLIHTNGAKAETGVRYTDETNIEKIQAIIRAKLVALGKNDTIAYISVDRSNLPAEKNL